jgi:hypothetical protein
MSIQQYKIRDINKNPELHKEVFVTYSDMKQLLNGLIDFAVKAGADENKLKLLVSPGKNKH